MRYEKPMVITLNGRMVSGADPLSCVGGNNAFPVCGVGNFPAVSSGCVNGPTDTECAEGSSAVHGCVDGAGNTAAGGECTTGLIGDTYPLCKSGSVAG